MTDLALAAVVAGFALHGWVQGGPRMALRAAAVVGGYAAAALFGGAAGRALTGFGLGPPIALALGGGATFVLTAGGILWLGRRVQRGDGPTPRSRGGGAALGIVYGMGVAVVLGWAVGALSGLSGGEPVDRRGVAVRSASRVVEGAARAAARRMLGDPSAAAATAALLADPGGAVRALERLGSDPRLAEFVADPGTLERLRRGGPAELARSPDLRTVAADPELVAALSSLGFVEEARPDDPDAVAGELATRLAPALETAAALRDDREFQEMLRDEAVQAALGSGDFMRLAASPEFAALARRVLDELRRHQPR